VSFAERLRAADLILGEGSLYERLRRDPAVQFDPELAHATLIYDETARAVLEGTHREYLDIGQAHRLPMLTASDTWRANRERQDRSGFRDRPVNQDNVRFLQDVRTSYGPDAAPILIGGSFGPRGDAYRPAAALTRHDAAAFHAPQVDALASAAPDYLIANTLPAVSEARGMADACAATGVPYLLSFVVRGDGTVLDGTRLADAIALIDDTASVPPAGFGVNCVHPTVLARALQATGPAAVRVVYFQANASALTPEELVGSEELVGDGPAELAEAIRTVRDHFGIRALGGCCGTGTAHIAAIATACELAPAGDGGAVP
jgi:homocysteine S-methyltransferase